MSILMSIRSLSKWVKTSKELTLKETGEKVFLFEVGEVDDESGVLIYEVPIRESTYLKLISGEYRISNYRNLEISDKDGNKIRYCYDGKETGIY